MAVRQPHEVLVVVRRGDEFLVVHRAPTRDAYWHLVSGGVEAGEAAAEAAARELLEETGLAAPVVDLGRRFTYGHEPWETVSVRFAEVAVDCFLADAPAGWEPKLDDEHDDYRWCSAAEAETLLFWPEPREAVRAVADAS
jgi:8-oxo-dGTP pyrophosphatase MutT (NUDIX family)